MDEKHCNEHSGCKTEIENNKNDIADIWSTINTIRKTVTDIQTGFVPKGLAIGITILTSTMTAIIGYQLAVINMLSKNQKAASLVGSILKYIF